MSLSWLQQQERGTPRALRLILWIAQHLGRRVAGILLYPITVYFLFKASKQRKASKAYLHRVLGNKANWCQIFRHIFCFASTILDRVYFFTDKFDAFNIHIHNREALLQYVDQKQGCLLLGSHLGSFEVLRALALELGRFELKILMYPEHNQTITMLLETLNPDIKDTIISLGDTFSMLKVAECLERGGMVGMLGDRIDQNSKTVECEFLGKKATFPIAPAFLASALKVPVVLFFGLYKVKGRYDIYFELLAEETVLDKKNREQAAQLWMQSYCTRLEYYAKLVPYNWFNFYDFWDEFE